MDIKIPKADLAKAVSRASSAVADKSPIASMRCVLVTAENDSITVRGTSIEHSVTVTTQAGVAKPGSVAIPAAHLREVVAEMPAVELRLKLDKNAVIVTGAKARARIPVLPADEFPQLPEPCSNAPKLELPSRELARLLSQVSYAQSTDDTRPHMSCVRLESDGKDVRAAATDSHRLGLAVAQIEASAFAESISHQETKLIERLASEHADDAVTLSVSGDESSGFLHLVWPDVTLAVKRTDQNFPPYRRVIPSSFAHRVLVSRQGLIDAIKRARTAADPGKTKQRQIRLDLAEGVLKVSAESSDRGAASDELDVDYAGGEWVSSGASEYIMQALAVIPDDDVRMCISGPLEPVVFVGATDETSCLSLVMPMKL